MNWKCDVCGEKIRSGKGYVVICDNETKGYPNAAARRRARRKEAFTAEQAAGDTPEEKARALLANAVTGVALWAIDPEYNELAVMHSACDPNPETGAYWIAVERIGTLDDWLRFVCHLSKKAWVNGSDVGRLLKLWHRNRGDASWPHTNPKPSRASAAG